jgi:hypothetical protein
VKTENASEKWEDEPMIARLSPIALTSARYLALRKDYFYFLKNTLSSAHSTKEIFLFSKQYFVDYPNRTLDKVMYLSSVNLRYSAKNDFVEFVLLTIDKI